MIETILAFFAGVIVSHWFIWPALVFAIFCDYREWKFMAVVSTALLGFAAYLIFQPPTAWLMYGALAYLPIGFLWSFFRYRRHVGTMVKQFNAYVKENKDNPQADLRYQRNSLDRESKISHNVDRVTYWVALWPISVVQSILDDVIAAIEHFVTKTLRRLYDGIRNSALKNVTEIED